ncbi:MAG: AraC family transcriptional regulator [Chthoniobacterales bacterium]
MDPLAAVVTLLKPQAVGAKIVHGHARWGVRYAGSGQPSYALILEGSCWLAVDGAPAATLETGDFVLIPAMPGFTVASDPDVEPVPMTPSPCEDMHEVFHGDTSAAPSVTMLGGYFAFDPVNASMLLALLPRMLRIRAAEPALDSLAPIVELIRREAGGKRAGRELVLTRLIEVMLVEALRSIPSDLDATGLLAGLRDPQLAAALRGIHTATARPWTLATLAREAAMSRSSFAERFARVTGATPVNYLLQWRLAVARNMLARERMSVAETALAVGYESASAFSTAFKRETGQSPKEFIAVHRGAIAL